MNNDHNTLSNPCGVFEPPECCALTCSGIMPGESREACNDRVVQ